MTISMIISFILVGTCLFFIYKLRDALFKTESQLEVAKDTTEILLSYSEIKDKPDFIDYLKKNCPVTLFGLNRFGKILVKYFSDRGITIDYIIDNFNRQEFMGKIPVTLSEYMEKQTISNPFIIVCVLRPEAYNIKTDLSKRFDRSRIKTVEELIVDGAYMLIEPVKNKEPQNIVENNSIKTNGIYTPYRFLPVQNREEWLNYSTRLKSQVKKACEFPVERQFSMEKVSRIKVTEFTGYRVESIVFHVLPGLDVCGNLFYPLESSSTQKKPAILSPHGHWDEGRFSLHDDYSVVKRCVYLVNLGFVVLSIDMVGYGETALTLGHTLFNEKKDSLWGIHLTGLQVFNLQFALDFLQHLNFVDADRIGCTGGSGGGTQTILLAAVDERIKAAAPVNILSAHMQGSCICENPPYLRIGTNNMEICALIAPRPLLLVGSSGDFTTNLPYIEFPAVRHIYSLFQKKENIECFYQEYPHNYNQVAREYVGKWFCKQFKLSVSDKENLHIPHIPSIDDLKVSATYSIKTPPSQEEFRNEIKRDILSRIHSDKPASKRIEYFREAFDFIFPFDTQAVSGLFALPLHEISKGAELHKPKPVTFSVYYGSRIVPGEIVFSTSEKESRVVLLYIDNKGIRGMYENERLKPFLAKNEIPGLSIASIDPLNVGSNRVERSRTEMFTTYNLIDTVLRIQDIAAVLTFFSQQGFKVILLGEGIGGLWALFANTISKPVQLGVYDFSFVKTFDDEFFTRHFCVPYIRRYNDIDAALSLLYNQPKILVTPPGGFSFPIAAAIHKEMNTMGNFTVTNVIPAPSNLFKEIY